MKKIASVGGVSKISPAEDQQPAASLSALDALKVWMWARQGILDPLPSLAGQQVMPPSLPPVWAVDIIFGRASSEV